MKYYTYRICLRSDAEPSSGLGNEMLNGLVPRDAQGLMVLPASHLKGIMRENLTRILAALLGPKSDDLVDYLFGRPGQEGDDGVPGRIHLTDAVADSVRAMTITRTAIGAAGQVKSGSLRTTEAIPAGSSLAGTIALALDGQQWEDLALLSLMSVTAVGGNRTRGSGNCQVVFDGLQATPGELLRRVQLEQLKPPPEEKPAVKPASRRTLDGSPPVCLRLRFQAEGPLCLPERPVGGTNVISSGFVIPATAVTGGILNVLNQADPELASACFASGEFRCWPLLPVVETGCRYAVRVSNTHKISKLKMPDGQHLFGDLLVDEEYYDWRKKAHGTILKGSDGVLNMMPDNKVTLWRDRDMPRLLRAHGVVNGTAEEKRDNLFTVESLCVPFFAGLVMLPEAAAHLLLECLSKTPLVCFGKSRTTRGNGTLTAELASQYWESHPQIAGLKNRLFVVQSPLVLADDTVVSPERPAAEYLQELLERQGWGKLDESSVALDVQFGWNRHRLERSASSSGGRVRARRVIEPGSVFSLETALADLPGKLLQGLQGGASHPGYGAVAPHPGIASSLYEGDSRGLDELHGDGEGAKLGYRLHQVTGTRLSASQIATLLAKLQQNVSLAEAYLEDQKRKRTKEIWDSWENTDKLLRDEGIIRHHDAVKALRVWLDLRISEYEEA